MDLTRHMHGLSPRYERLYRGEDPYTSPAGALSTIRAIVSWRGPLHVTCGSPLHDTSDCIVERTLTRHMSEPSPRYERLYRGEEPYTSNVRALSMIHSLVSWRGCLLKMTCNDFFQLRGPPHQGGSSPRYKRLYRGERPFLDHQASSQLGSQVERGLRSSKRAPLHDTSACIVERTPPWWGGPLN